MAYSSDEDDRGRHHTDYRTDRADCHRSRSGRERGRLYDPQSYNKRADLESMNNDKEDSSGSSVCTWSGGTRDSERATRQHQLEHHHQHPRRARSPSRNPKPSHRGRSKIKRNDRITYFHTRHSHSAQPSRNHRRHRSRARSLSPAQEGHGVRMRGRLAEKAVGTAAQVAYRLRNSEGSWMGSKGLKIVGATVATTAIDAVFDRHPKEHALRHVAVSMVEAAVMDVFSTSSPLCK